MRLGFDDEGRCLILVDEPGNACEVILQVAVIGLKLTA